MYKTRCTESLSAWQRPGIRFHPWPVYAACCPLSLPPFSCHFSSYPINNKRCKKPQSILWKTQSKTFTTSCLSAINDVRATTNSLNGRRHHRRIAVLFILLSETCLEDPFHICVDVLHSLVLFRLNTLLSYASWK